MHISAWHSLVRDSPWRTIPLFSTLCSNMNSWKLYSFQGSGLAKDEHHFGDLEYNSPRDITGVVFVGSPGQEDSMVWAPPLPYPMSQHSGITSHRATQQYLKPSLRCTAPICQWAPWKQCYHTFSVPALSSLAYTWLMQARFLQSSKSTGFYLVSNLLLCLFLSQCLASSLQYYTEMKQSSRKNVFSI